MANVIHTVNVIYGSYYQEGIKIVCDENDDNDDIKAKVRRKLNLNFLSMATYQVKVVDSEMCED